MKKYGFIIHYVQGDNQFPANIHTHGLPDSWDHPDIQIVLPLSPSVAGSLLHTSVDEIRKGNALETGKTYDHVLVGFNVMFAWVTENDRDVLRMILPDKEGKLSKDEMSEPYKIQWEGTYAKAPGNGYR